MCPFSCIWSHKNKKQNFIHFLVLNNVAEDYDYDDEDDEDNGTVAVAIVDLIYDLCILRCRPIP